MRWVLERIFEPEIEPVSLAEAKLHLRTFDSDDSEDDYIESLIVAAREMVEYHTGRALVDQTWRLSLDADTVTHGEDYSGQVVRSDSTLRVEQVREITLPRSPALSIVSFTSIDSAGTETAIASDTYQLRDADSKWPKLVALSGSSWGYSRMRVTFRAGFADRDASPQQGGEAVPRAIISAMKLIIGHLYENRESVVVGTITGDLPMGVKWLLQSQKSNTGMA